MSSQLGLWIAFGTLVPAMLALDLGVFHRKAHTIKVREALLWSAVWIALALLFNLSIYFLLGSDKALKFFTGPIYRVHLKSVRHSGFACFILCSGWRNTTVALPPLRSRGYPRLSGDKDAIFRILSNTFEPGAGGSCRYTARFSFRLGGSTEKVCLI